LVALAPIVLIFTRDTYKLNQIQQLPQSEAEGFGGYNSYGKPSLDNVKSPRVDSAEEDSKSGSNDTPSGDSGPQVVKGERLSSLEDDVKKTKGKKDGEQIGSFTNIFGDAKVNKKQTMETKMSLTNLTMKSSQMSDAQGLVSTDRGKVPKPELVISGFVENPQAHQVSEESFDFGEDQVKVAPLGQSAVNVRSDARTGSVLTQSTTSLVGGGRDPLKKSRNTIADISPSKKRGTTTLGLPSRVQTLGGKSPMGEGYLPKSGVFGDEAQIREAPVKDEEIPKKKGSSGNGESWD